MYCCLRRVLVLLNIETTLDKRGHYFVQILLKITNNSCIIEFHTHKEASISYRSRRRQWRSRSATTFANTTVHPANAVPHFCNSRTTLRLSLQLGLAFLIDLLKRRNNLHKVIAWVL